MKQFYLITNKVKDPDSFYTQKIISYLEMHGANVACVENMEKFSERLEVISARHLQEPLEKSWQGFLQFF